MEIEQQLLLLYARLKKEAERCTIYAIRAKKDEKAELSLLFRALSASYTMQAQRFLVQLRGSVAATDANEKTAFDKEIPEFIQEYEKMLKEAQKENNKALETGFRHSSAVQQRNLDLHALLGERSFDSGYFVCDFCGYIVTDEPPENCPVCTAPRKRFIEVDSC